MKLPAHIVSYLEDLLASAAGRAEHGGVTLYADMGGSVVLCPTGVFLSVTDADGRVEEERDERWQTIALVAGARKHPILRELLPVRPGSAVDCAECSGQGRAYPSPAGGIICGACAGLGWRVAAG